MTDQLEQKEEREYTEVEQLALELDWDPKGRKDAKTFLKDGLKIRNEKITDLYKLSDNLKELMSKQEAAIYSKAKAELLAERDEAIARGDIQAVKNIEEQQSQMELYNKIQAAKDEFIHRNAEWYNSNLPQHIKMQQAVAQADITIAQRRLPPEAHFAALEEYVKEEFPDYFGEPKKRAQVVESGRSTISTQSSKKKFTIDDLTPQQKQFAKMFAKQGIMTEEKYIDELVKAGTLK